MAEVGESGLTQRLTGYFRRNVFSPRLVRFVLVGATGVVVNMGVLYALTEFARIPYFVGGLAAIELSILSNFWLNLLWTWKDRSDAGTLWTKLWRYHVGAGVTAFLGNYLVLLGLTAWFGINYLISNLAGIGVGTLSNYIINDVWTFRNRSGEPREN